MEQKTIYFDSQKVFDATFSEQSFYACVSSSQEMVMKIVTGRVTGGLATIDSDGFPPRRGPPAATASESR